MKVVVVGTGYVGLVSGLCLAEIGHSVVCVDIDLEKVNLINRGICPIYEEGLQSMLTKQLRDNRFRATNKISEAMQYADISIIAVGTPFDGNRIDLSYVEQVAHEIGCHLPRDRFHIVCVKSTVLPGTTSGLVGPLIESASGLQTNKDFGLCMNPEFLAEGTAVKDFMQPDRIVIGTHCNRTADIMRRLYVEFPHADVYITNPTTAEMGKYAANSLLATLISFSNEIADICGKCAEVDVMAVMESVCLDRRLSPITDHGRISPGLLKFLRAGTGFGGSCFPKDLKAITAFGSSLGANTALLNSVISRNSIQPLELLKLLDSQLGTDLAGKSITILGLAFKPGTDDIRESPAISIIEKLLKRQANVIAHDPVAGASMKNIFPNIIYAPSLELATRKTDAVLLVTAWSEYEALPKLLKGRKIPVIDGRRFFEQNAFHKYCGIGLAPPIHNLENRAIKKC
jgi:UDPglucose 6-dehydrogenase